MLLALAAGTAGAQDHGHSPRREQLRQRIEERFTSRVKERLGLTEEQTRKLQETSREFGGRRRELEARERIVREALTQQLRPGIAADRDSVARLTELALELRVAYAQSFRDELRETSNFLDPVQRAQLFTMRDRLLRRAREIRGERWHHDRHRYRRQAPARESDDS
jgi:hypothetical protein